MTTVVVGPVVVTMTVDTHPGRTAAGKCSCGCGVGQVLKVTAKKAGKSYARAKSFKGETGWMDAERYANDLVMQAQRETGCRANGWFA